MLLIEVDTYTNFSLGEMALIHEYLQKLTLKYVVAKKRTVATVREHASV